MMPFSAIPTFLTLTDGQSPDHRTRTARLAAFTVVVILIIVALTGDLVLEVLGTTLNSFRIGGGLVLLMGALTVLSGHAGSGTTAGGAGNRSVAIVPLGTPVIAGPGAITTVIIEVGHASEPAHLATVIGCIVAVTAVMWILLRLSSRIGQRLGETTLSNFNRFFGLLLAAVAIEYIVTGLRGSFPVLAS